MFHPSNRFIIHECLSFYYFELWKSFHPRKPIYHPQELFSFIWGCGNIFIQETDLSSTGAFFGFYSGAVEKTSSTKPICHLREFVFLFIWAVEN
jgi:hypothetical protein